MFKKSGRVDQSNLVNITGIFDVISDTSVRNIPKVLEATIVASLVGQLALAEMGLWD